MKKLCTADQMHHMDQTAMYGKYKIAPVVLMENAGHAVVEKAKSLIISWHNKMVIVFAEKEITEAMGLSLPVIYWLKEHMFLYMF